MASEFFFEVVMMEPNESIMSIGRSVAEYRGRLGKALTQERLAKKLGMKRTAIAFLEEGRELPAPDDLGRICRHLRIPDRCWMMGTHPFFLKAMEFESLLSELIGRHAQHDSLDGVDQLRAADRIQRLFKGGLTETQSHAKFNAVMVLYGERPVTAEFFSRYLGDKTFADIRSFERSIRRFQIDAMRLYGNFRRAWTRLSRKSPLNVELQPLDIVPLDSYGHRTEFTAITEIEPKRLPQLGYIAVNRIKEENRERAELANYLEDLATAVETSGTLQALQHLSPKRRRRMQTLLRKLGVDDIELEYGLFYRIDSAFLRATARRLAPGQADLVQIEETQRQGLMNLSGYLTEPYMDVYVATSMREDADFVSVNAFVRQLFAHKDIRPLKLRFFNPTQSWIEDRVAKGLVEALMLRRAKVTVYMAQKGDTFGKDSEASVALGQGKPVIVYVPRLFDAVAHLDSEHLYRLDEKALDKELSKLGLEAEEGVDRRAKARLVLQSQLQRLSAVDMKRVVANHWADFDLYGELAKLANEELRTRCYEFMRSVRTAKKPADAIDPTPDVAGEVANRLAAVAEAFESRAVTFREVHPLALQVIVRSGVVNGIIVTRSVDSCAKVLRGVVGNSLEMTLLIEGHNYRLVERDTQSTLRVVSRHHLLTNAFWSQYFEDGGSPSEISSLDATTI